ncbi:MAG: ATP-binding protein [bacterium]
MVPRILKATLEESARYFPVVTVTGPRQSGKSTLCRAVFADRAYLSLEDPELLTYALQDPRGFLNARPDGGIIDEVQRAPELLSYLQVDVDGKRDMGRWVLTGSANLALLQSVSQSLAGRSAVLTLLPCSLDELRAFESWPDSGSVWEAVWTGGYPAIFDRQIPPARWFAAYVRTYVERDVRQILQVGDLLAFQTFMRLAAGRTGQLLNLSGLGKDAGVSHNTAKAWLSVLEATYIAHRLPPYHANWVKRQVKTPKLLFHDSGLVCYLLGIQSSEQLRLHPLRGAIFETWVAAEVTRARLHRGVEHPLYFYRSRDGLEVDLLVERGPDLVAVESKSGETVPGDAFAALDALEAQLITRAAAIGTLHKVLAYAGDHRQDRTTGTVLPWSELPEFSWCEAGADGTAPTSR